MNAADFLAGINAKFAEPEEYETAMATIRDLQSRADRLSKALEIKHAAQERAEAERDAARALLREAGEVVKWYGENARLCRLIHSGGDTGRQSLSNDGGKRARAFLDKLGSNND